MDKNFWHYCPNVEDDTCDFMRGLVVAVTDALIDRIGEAVNCAYNVEIIPGIDLPGFWAFTEGGWEVVLNACLGDATRGNVPPLIKKDYASSLEDCKRTFCHDYGIPVHMFDEIWDDSSLFSSLREEYDRYEMDWMTNESTYYYKVRATQKNGVVTFLTMLNRDYEYGRDDLTSAGLPHVDPNSNVTEANYKVSDIPNLDYEDVAKELLPIIFTNLEV